MGKLGLVPGGYRATKPIPAALKALVPAPADSVRTMLPHDPDVETETMPHIISKTKRCAWQVKKLAAHLKGSTVAESCRNILQFILDYIGYKLDSPNHEQVRSPRRLVYDGHGDCDCFAVFIGACLLNLKIPFVFRIAKYTNKTSDWSHIYVVAFNGGTPITMDPVANAHNVEVPYTEKKDFFINQKVMNGLNGLQSLDGLACCGTQGYSTIKKPTTTVVASAQDLKEKGLVPTANLLQEAGIPATKRVLNDGSMRLAVTDKQGKEKLLPIVSPMGANINQKINPMNNSPVRWAVPQSHLSKERSLPMANPIGANFSNTINMSNGKLIPSKHPLPMVSRISDKNINPAMPVPIKEMSKPQSTCGLLLMAAGAVLVCVAVFTPSAKKDARLSGHRKKKAASMNF